MEIAGGSGLLSVRAGLPSAAFVFALAALAVLLLDRVPEPRSSGAGAELRVERAYGDLPLAFEQNRGQAPGRSDFIARSTSGTALISDRGATIALPDASGSEAIALRLRGADAAEARPIARLPGEVNYFLGDDPSRWRTGIETHARVRYEGVYRGIDIDWYGNQRRLEYDFRLSPGANPGRISLRVGGAQELRVAAGGDLVIDAGRDLVRQRQPIAYQRVGGDRVRVRARYTVDGERVGFHLGRYDSGRRLVIDPLVLDYSTYLGGGDIENGEALAIDSSGAAYVTGYTRSADFPISGSGSDSSLGGNLDAYVAKLDPGGSALAYSTYLGGDADDFGQGVAIDAGGSAYVTGQTESDDFPAEGGVIDPSLGGSHDAFMTRLDPQGALAYSTYLGGSGVDGGNAIAFGDGRAHVTGATRSADFPTAGSGVDTTLTGVSDAFVTRISSVGLKNYSTYLGGSDRERGSGIAVDASGSAHIAGTTSSIDFPKTAGVLDSTYGGSDDAFATKLTSAGAIAYSTFLGGTSTDSGNAIALDAGGSAYIGGGTASGDFPTGAGALDPTLEGIQDAFVSKLDPAATALTYSTYLGGAAGGGGPGDDVAYAIAVDATGAAYVTGETEATDFPTSPGTFDDSPGGGYDAFLSKLDPGGGALAFSTYLGGTGSDIGRGIAVDASGAAYLTGTATAGFPTGAGAFDSTLGGTQDSVVAKLSDTEAPPPGPGPGPGPDPTPGASCNGKPATIVGTGAAETLVGTPDPDVMVGLGGKDRLSGRGANDVLCGGAGGDRVLGGGGRDLLFGSKGRDRLAGGPGKGDRCNGGKGRRDVAAKSCEKSRGTP